MAEWIPSYTITEFKRLKVHQLRELKCCEIVSDGEYLFTFINSTIPNIRIHAEQLGLRANTVGGKYLEEIQEVEHSPL